MTIKRFAGLRVTREGWYWLLGSLVLCFTGLIRGINLLMLLGCLMLVVWILHLVSSWRGLKGLIGRRFLETPIFAQTPFLLRVDIRNGRTAHLVGLLLYGKWPTH